MLFSEAVTEYMGDKSKRLRATTLEGYRSAIRCHLMPQWGAREIETITFEEVQDWVDGFTLPGAAEKAYSCRGMRRHRIGAVRLPGRFDGRKERRRAAARLRCFCYFAAASLGPLL